MAHHEVAEPAGTSGTETAFHRQDGFTPSERALDRVCKRAVLSLWSYLNVFTDRGRSGAKGDGKELCDLLVIFGDDVLIFSDKECHVPGGATNDAWARWYKRAIEKSVKQVLGAERWLREHPDRVFLDSHCSVRFPLPWPANPRFHRIVVATGAREACLRLTGSEDIALTSRVLGDGHTDANATPFLIGRPDAQRFVHVFDERTLFAVLDLLDTVSDLVRYLSAKESLIHSGRLGYARDELCLLAVYLATAPVDDTTREFPGTRENASVFIDPNAWRDLQENPNFRRKFVADRGSHLWDGLIEEFSKNLQAGRLLGPNNGVADTERLLRAMATTSRVERRHLAKALIDAREMARGKQFGARTVARGGGGNGIVFACLAVTKKDDESYAEYRRYRQALLLSYAKVTALRFRAAGQIVAVAIDADGSRGGSEDAVLYEPGQWSSELEAEVRRLAVKLGLQPSPRVTGLRDHEFPATIARSPLEHRKEKNRQKRLRRASRGK